MVVTDAELKRWEVALLKAQHTPAREATRDAAEELLDAATGYGLEYCDTTDYGLASICPECRGRIHTPTCEYGAKWNAYRAAVKAEKGTKP